MRNSLACPAVTDDVGCGDCTGVLVSPSAVLHTNFRSLTISLLSAGGDELGDPAGPSDTSADTSSSTRRAAQEGVVSKLLGEMVLYNSKDEVGCLPLPPVDVMGVVDVMDVRRNTLLKRLRFV